MNLISKTDCLVDINTPVLDAVKKASAICSVLLATAMMALGSAASADIGATHTSLVSEFASFNTPGVVDGRVEAIAVDGDTVFVGGTFTQIHDPLSDEIIDQPYLFAYSKSSGDIIREFDPILNNEVLALETTGDGTGVFAGGVFNSINGETNRRGIVKIADNGDRVPGFGARADALIKTLVRLDDTLYVGGNFTSISGTPVEHLAAVDTTTGAVRPELNLDFDGVISTDRTNGVQGVDDIDITSDGRLLLMFGNFSVIDGISRHRLALIELDGQARVSQWNTDIFDPQCASLWPVQLRGIDIAPDDTYFIVGTSGARQGLNPACDTITRFDIDDLTDTDVQPTWINFTGGDTVFEVVATEHAVYAGGHFRWLDNFNSTNARSGGPGSTDRLGLAAFDPLNGLTLRKWRSDRNPRGVGTFALIAEPEGLYIGDDTDFLNGTEHKKLKFLPITDEVIARPDAPTLPTTLVANNSLGVSGLNTSSFNGTTIGASVQLSNSEFGSATAAMFVGGQLFFANTLGEMRVRTLADDTLGSVAVVDLFGMTEDEWVLSQLGGMFFDYGLSRVYYTIRGDSRLFYRAFSPDGTFFGDRQVEAEQQGDILWGDVTSMDVIDGHLYFTRTDSSLYRADIDGADVISGTTVLISGPAIDGRSWDNSMLAFLGEGTVIDAGGNGVDAQIQFDSSGDSNGTGRFRQFEFPVVAGEPVELRLEWLDPDANLRLFVRDANDVLVASDTTGAGSPKFLTVPAGDGGTYTASVLVAAGSTAYSLLINPDEAGPEPRADFEFGSGGDQNEGRFQVFDFNVEAGELVEAQVIWEDPTAEVRLFLRDETNTSVARDTDGVGGTAMASAIAQTSGQWSVAVLIANGATRYDVLVDTSSDFVAPDPLADFEFSSSGTQESANGRFQSFEFDVVAGETIDAQLNWDDLGADVALFLRDENRTQVARNSTGIGSAALSVVATSTGTWSAAVSIREADGTVNYDLLVDTSTGDEPAVTVAITSQPTNVTVTEGDDASFSVTATGSGTLAYQWFADGSTIAGATGSTLTLSAVTLNDTGTDYSVEVTDNNGTVASDSATLTVEQATPPPEVTNIALNGTASQSSTGFNGAASRAIDGNTNGSYGNRSVTHTQNSAQPWWEVQLDGPSTIETITLFNRTDNCCTSRLSNYSVSIIDGNGTTVFSRDFTDPPDPSNTIDVGGIVGSMVRVQLNGTNALSLAEVQVLGYAQ